MAIAILVGRDSTEQQAFLPWFSMEWKRLLLDLDPSLDIRIYPEVGETDDVKCALVWQPPLGELKRFKNLKAILSLAAGVDHIMADKNLPQGVPIARVIDPHMGNEIVQYVVVTVLNYLRRMQNWAIKQQEKVWAKVPPFNYCDKTIGIMGLGFLGKQAALALHRLGLQVIGWSNSPKQIPDIKDYVGKAQFHEFLSKADVLICMLPLTKETENILNKETFAHLPKGAYLINLGRGQHLVEQDLIDALNGGHLSGATLDVFRQEPLPEIHPFWSHPKVHITPHIASVTNPASAIPQIYANISRVIADKTLLNCIDLQKGY